jgi:hypothetical protein
MKNVAIPLEGKMAFRSFNTDLFIRQLAGHDCRPVYYIEQKFLTPDLDRARYSLLQKTKYKDVYNRPIPKFLSELRRFLVHTETTELRFRDTLLNLTFNKRPITQVLLYMLGLDVVRRMRFAAPPLLALEQKLTASDFHNVDLRQREIRCVLTPGVGSYGFLYEGLVAREARTCGIPTVAAVSNYDNIVNRGYMGFVPDVLTVWSEQMAEEARRCLRLPPAKIAVTGPVQFDRYAAAPAMTRDAFLRSKGLDPSKKTIFFAGGVMVTHYYEFLRFMREYLMSNGTLKDYNVVIRPTPHNKILSWYGMTALKEILSQIKGVYYSDPHAFSSDSFMPVAGERCDIELDELHCLFKYSDVMLNVYSTVGLEAAVNDLPTVYIGYENFSYAQRYPSYPDFQAGMTHNLRPLRLAAGKVARSDKELKEYIDHYLSDRKLDQDARQAYAVAECGQVDGKAGERLAAVIGQAAGGA